MNYKVYQGTELKQTVTSKTAVMNGLQPNLTYEFGVQPNDGTRDGTKVTTSVTTRGIRFNIPKTLTIGSTITLRYEEYSLGIVPIGNEPSGYFGGGNRQNLSAKVISTANGSSVVEVAGNVIEVGGKNLLPSPHQDTVIDDTANTGTNGWSFHVFNFTQQPKIGDHITVSAEGILTGRGDLSTYGVVLYDSYQSNGGARSDSKRLTAGERSSATLEVNNLNGTGDTTLLIYAGNINDTEGKKNVIHHLKVEPGTIATPYASFVDGDTFAAQPDGTCALFSEYKALYY
ncbi:hypothetical protein [Paucilactobacillus nenjiangensis]|uniref:Baseplate upper protein immunoglobulin like domain-containing protein n=1 Tax=Paucilactobacillus nenjiangensis TaxID=1296540 RepID=A0A5P1X0Z8_9LACO|nr:hypothetical protein [Paucilactobacillus nenjiangensis]QER67570.1 hypothetical protein F0161_06670 [Paucilactobacillus nenjiangensis]